MNATPCAQHKPGSDVWQPTCSVCGVRLLDGISIAQLVGRVEALVQEPIQPTGRIRGTWTEVLEEGDGQLWAYWVRPARNFAGYEAVDCSDPEPTGEQLSGLLLAELAGLPAHTPVALPEPSWAPSHRKPSAPSRWSRFVRWSRRSADREFVTIATPLSLFWAVALWVVLGNDGVAAVWSVLF
ncbi:hypothetical protein ACWEWD_34415 [Streptomyces tendae]